MSSLNQIIRRTSSMIDTSGALPPAVASSGRMTPGVYADTANGSSANDEVDAILHGRISLGIIAAAIVGAVGFYYVTRSIQGGG